MHLLEGSRDEILDRFCVLNDNQWPDGVDKPADSDDWGHDQLIQYGLATVYSVVKPWEAMDHFRAKKSRTSKPSERRGKPGKRS